MTDTRQPPPSSTANSTTAAAQAKPSAVSEKHWLVRPDSIRKLWLIFIAILVGTVAAQIFVHVHAEFDIDGTFGFNAWYGFGACVVLIVVAKLLGILIKRIDTYYENQSDEA